MTDESTPEPTTPEPATPEPAPTTVVGYPGAAPAGGQSNPGMASLRSAVSVTRALVIASLALLVVVAGGLVVGVASLRAQVDALGQQVTELTAAAGQAAQAAAQAPAAAAPEPAAEPQTPQLGAAGELPDGVSVPAGFDATGAVLIGDPAATDVVEVYVDYQCPYCQKWEQEVGAALVERALQPGSGLLVKQYNLAFLQETSPDLQPAGASARAASAAACVLDADGVEVFAEFNTAIFATADPAEPPTQFMADALSAIARDSGASDAAIACIEEERHVPFVATSTQSGFGRGVGGTPTVIVNGRTLDNPFTDGDLMTLAAG